MGKSGSKSLSGDGQGSGSQLVLMEEGVDGKVGVMGRHHERGLALELMTKDDVSQTAEEERRRVPPDMANMALLVLLYAMQGVPLGLSLGSIPFVLKAHASYTEIGLFSLAGYPYALKLLWSPLVDTLYFPSVGCRKSWVLPIQTLSGLLMIVSAPAAQHWLDTTNVRAITSLFFVFVLLAATQDIAVDGWALTLLSRQNIGHASTCQTIGINTGYFASFTIFLALNDASFCNRYLRKFPQEQGLVSLHAYFTFWGVLYILVTFLLAFKPEKAPSVPSPPPTPRSQSSPEDDVAFPSPSTRSMSQNLARRGSAISYDGQRRSNGEDFSSVSHDGHDGLLASAGRHADEEERAASEGSRKLRRLRPGLGRRLLIMYGRLWRVATLKHIRSLTVVLLLCKLGTITAEAAGVFKLMEKGVSRETISLIVLVEFPLELLFAFLAGRWASAGRPFTPWLSAYFLRLVMAAVTTLLVAVFPQGASIQAAPAFYAALVGAGIMTSFSSTIMFVSQGTFFARISDSSMGGTYLTLLNTISNLGSAWPKFFVFTLMDWLTVQSCRGVDLQSLGPNPPRLVCPIKPSDTVVNTCIQHGGRCVQWLDGFYPLSLSLVSIGLSIGYFYRRTLHDLELAKEDSWRA